MKNEEIGRCRKQYNLCIRQEPTINLRQVICTLSNDIILNEGPTNLRSRHSLRVIHDKFATRDLLGCSERRRVED